MRTNGTTTTAVEAIRTARTKGMTQTEAATYLNKAGFKTSTGKRWNSHSVNYVAKTNDIDWVRGRKSFTGTVTNGHTVTGTRVGTRVEWVTAIREVSTSNLSPATKAYVTGLIVAGV